MAVDPIRQLWTAVLFLALADADAPRYVYTKDFRTVATLAGLDPDAVRDAIGKRGPLSRRQGRRRAA